MEYSGYRSKIIVWVALLFVIMIGSQVLAGREAGAIDTSRLVDTSAGFNTQNTNETNVDIKQNTQKSSKIKIRRAWDTIVSIPATVTKPVSVTSSTSIDVDVRNAIDTHAIEQVTTDDIDVISDEYIDDVADIVSPTQEVANDVVISQDIMYINDTQYVDMSVLRSTWLQWSNYLRVDQLGRTAYVENSRLDATAQAWSDYSASIGSISHKRSSGDGYYNYNGLVSWFKWKGEELTGTPIVFANVSRATFSESIGWGMWSCSEEDCTDEMIEATRSTWNFFYAERSYNGVHYRALTHPNFGIQGLGLATSSNKYYLTIHYGTSIIE